MKTVQPKYLARACVFSMIFRISSMPLKISISSSSSFAHWTARRQLALFIGSLRSGRRPSAPCTITNVHQNHKQRIAAPSGARLAAILLHCLETAKSRFVVLALGGWRRCVLLRLRGSLEHVVLGPRCPLCLAVVSGYPLQLKCVSPTNAAVHLTPWPFNCIQQPEALQPQPE